MKYHATLRLAATIVVGLLLCAPAAAALAPHALFSDHAVLQRNAKVAVWGTTDATDDVNLSFAGQKVTTKPQDGRWKVELAPLAAGGPHVMVITQGQQTVELKNILVGEVWLCGGQSNMQWAIKQADGASEAIATAANDRLRLFTVPRRGSDKPEANVDGSWQVAGPSTIPDFSAVGYYFGRELQKQLGVPVGLISSNYGGTAAEQWTSAETLAAHPELKDMSKPQGASMLFNAMIAPLTPYAIQGAIWYQGESNAGRAYQYRTLLPQMIRNWREAFGQGDFPFLIVQIAPYDPEKSKSPDSIWAEIRDAQLHVSRQVPRTSLIVTTDVGDETDIHPRKKEPVGARLALAARAVAYSEKIEHSGPLYDSMSIEGSKIRLRFQHVGRGLIAKGGPLAGFTIASEDRKFHPAQAVIDGDSVLVSSDQVTVPTAARYGWTGFPVVNLWNRDGLPASPFRTDDFPITTQDKK